MSFQERKKEGPFFRSATWTYGVRPRDSAARTVRGPGRTYGRKAFASRNASDSDSDSDSSSGSGSGSGSQIKAASQTPASNKYPLRSSAA
jgi:hypothetical protein